MSIAWSFSSLSDFFNCPRAYQLKRVLKVFPFVETEAMRYGTECHKHLEDRVRDKKPLPAHLAWMENSMVAFEKSGKQLTPETQVALNKDLRPVGWFDKDVWLRGVFDLAVRAMRSTTILDYKSGKRKPNSDQLMLFAGMEMAVFPRVEEVKTGFIWLKDKKIDSEVFTRDDVGRIWGHFIPKVEKLERAYREDDWPCRPSGLCSYCPANKSQCKHAKE